MGHEADEGDPNPQACPEDDADLTRPHAEQMEEAIGNFMDDMEKLEHFGFTHIHTFLSKLPVPVHIKCHATSAISMYPVRLVFAILPLLP